jgi:hypothetical protein
MSGRWRGVVSEIKIFMCSSGGYKAGVETYILEKRKCYK